MTTTYPPTTVVEQAYPPCYGARAPGRGLGPGGVQGGRSPRIRRKVASLSLALFALVAAIWGVLLIPLARRGDAEPAARSPARDTPARIARGACPWSTGDPPAADPDPEGSGEPQGGAPVHREAAAAAALALRPRRRRTAARRRRARGAAPGRGRVAPSTE
jgi:hypothetical protein